MGSMGRRQGEIKVMIPSRNETTYCIYHTSPGGPDGGRPARLTVSLMLNAPFRFVFVGLLYTAWMAFSVTWSHRTQAVCLLARSWPRRFPRLVPE